MCQECYAEAEKSMPKPLIVNGKVLWVQLGFNDYVGGDFNPEVQVTITDEDNNIVDRFSEPAGDDLIINWWVNDMKEFVSWYEYDGKLYFRCYDDSMRVVKHIEIWLNDGVYGPVTMTVEYESGPRQVVNPLELKNMPADMERLRSLLRHLKYYRRDKWVWNAAK